ncbi:MAG TPA: hypothetical protein VGR19_10270 [Allosphingosinicella sp.]|nr:hypothetical protein [Allosphingosinicella sp.]
MSELLADTATARKRRKTIALALAAVTLVLLIISFLWWRSLPEEEGTVVPKTAAATEMSAADIFAEYQRDPTLARLDNQPILITANLAAAPTTGTVILLGTPDPLLPLGAEVDPRDAVKLSAAKAGTEISLRCAGAEPGVRAPMLQSCTLQ